MNEGVSFVIQQWQYQSYLKIHLHKTSKINHSPISTVLAETFIQIVSSTEAVLTSMECLFSVLLLSNLTLQSIGKLYCLHSHLARSAQHHSIELVTGHKQMLPCYCRRGSRTACMLDANACVSNAVHILRSTSTHNWIIHIRPELIVILVGAATNMFNFRYWAVHI